MKKIILTIAVTLTALSITAQPVLLHEFGSNPSEGVKPRSALVSDGTFLYGTTDEGGTNNLGSVYKIMPDGTGYARILDFDGATKGAQPTGAIYTDGTYLYGMTYTGGANNTGTVYKVKNDGTGFTKLLDFGGGIGQNPAGTFVSDGTFLYGMTKSGGIAGGTIFKIKPDGTGYASVYSFDGTHGGDAAGSLIYDGTFLYGMTYNGGTSPSDPMGTVFKIKPDGTSFSLLYEFTGPNGSHPYGSLYSDGTFLYGTTYEGGANSVGVIFKIKTDGTSFSKLLDFDGSTNGSHPCYGAFVEVGGFLYNTASDGAAHNLGNIFKIKTDGTSFTDVYDFEVTHGAFSQAGFTVIGTDLYSASFGGGINSDGVVYKIGTTTAGISSLQNSEELGIFPNPTSGKLRIETTAGAITTFNMEIFNAGGQLVYNNTHQHVSQDIDLAGFAKGTYFIKIHNHGAICVKKITIQ